MIIYKPIESEIKFYLWGLEYADYILCREARLTPPEMVWLNLVLF